MTPHSAARLVAAFVATAVAAGLLAVTAGPSAGSADTRPAVSVVGNRLVDGTGTPLRLAGVNRSGSEYACVQGWGIFSGPADGDAIRPMAAWGTNAVRVPLNQDCWLGTGVAPAYGGEAYRTAIRGYVDRLHAAGLLAVLDLHWNRGARPRATDQAQMPDGGSPAFWSSVATTFRADPGVLFDLHNEPYDVSWKCWRDGCTTAAGWQAVGMQELVDAVRATGARQPIVLTGLGWGNDLSGWLAHRPHDPAGQLVAGVHVYDHSQCATETCWDAVVAPVAAQVPVLTGEVGEIGCGGAFTRRYLDWADRHGVSFLGWTWTLFDCSKGQVALITSYDGTPTPLGAVVRERIGAVRAAAPVAPTPTATSTPTATAAPTATTPATTAPSASTAPAAEGTPLVVQPEPRRGAAAVVAAYRRVGTKRASDR